MALTQTEPTTRTGRKKERTKQKVLAVALPLFREKGFDATTMEEIAEGADIAKGTLYNYFPVKEAILDEYIKRSFQEHNAEHIHQMRELPDTHSRLSLILGDLLRGIQAQKELFEKYFTYRIKNMISMQEDESVQSGFSGLTGELVDLGQASGELRRDQPRYLLIDLVEFTFVEVAQTFYTDPVHFDAHETIERCVDLFMNGAASRD